MQENYNFQNPQPQRNIKETMSLVFGIISIVLGFSGIWGIALGIAAIILGKASIQEIGETKNAKTGKTCGTVGVIIGIIVMVLIVLVMVFWYGAVASIT